jgi:hypothetical protein
MMTVRPGELATPRALTGALVLALAFIAYTADTSSHADTRTFDARIEWGRATVGSDDAIAVALSHGRGRYEAAANASATFGQLTTFQNASM